MVAMERHVVDVWSGSTVCFETQHSAASAFPLRNLGRTRWLVRFRLAVPCSAAKQGFGDPQPTLLFPPPRNSFCNPPLPCESSIPGLLGAALADHLKPVNAQHSRYLDDVPTVNRRHASLGLGNRPFAHCGHWKRRHASLPAVA